MLILKSNSKIPSEYRNPMVRNNPARGEAVPRLRKLSVTARDWTPYEKCTPYWWNSHYGCVRK